MTASTSYTYRVRAFNAGGNSAYSNVATGITATPPAAPTNLTTTLISSSQINLSWTNTASNADGYLVEQSLDGTTFTQFGSAFTILSNSAPNPLWSATGATNLIYRRTIDLSSIGALLNVGTGTYQDTTATRLPVSGDRTSNVVVGDFNGDGKADVYLNDEGQSRLYYWKP